ncbi:MAG TPA: Gfo/Idh/MocA family oxidoreductase [Rariglobus sp.]|nr:Gfo/Idh/MocA family oxidoreductase [Rariglobus sp.]
MTSITSDLKVAVVGCGYAGRCHAHAYSITLGVKLVAVCDIQPAAAEKAATAFGVTAYTSFEAMLAKEKPDVVSIATRESNHEIPVIHALESGAAVFCEKIMADTVQAGERMVAAARRTEGMLAVNYNYRTLPGFAAIKARLASGATGAVPLAVAQTHAYLWHHMLDMLRFYFGDALEVSATLKGNPEDTPYDWRGQDEMLYIPSLAASATFRFSSGAVATLAATKHTSFDRHLMEISLYGENERIQLVDITPANTCGRFIDGPLVDALRTTPAVTLDQSFDLSIAAFVKALRAGDPPPATGEDGLRVLYMENAVVRAARENRTVKIQNAL